MTDYYNQLPIANTSSMKFTIDGRPTVNDIHDLFSALMAQIKLSNHKLIFRNYPDTFTSEEAIQELSSLRFTQSHFIPNVRYPIELKSTKTTTTFNVERDMAKALIQQFLWTRLIENAAESQNRTYKDKGIWRLKNKGLCVLQDFCLRTKSEMMHSQINMDAFKPLPLIYVERNDENDRFINSKKHLSVLFTILIASLPIGGNEKEKPKPTQKKRIGVPVSPLQFDFFSEGPTPSRMGSTRSGKSGALSFNDSSTVSSSSSQGSSGLPSLGGLSINDIFPSVKVLTNDMFVSKNSESDTIHHTQESSSGGLSFLKNKFKMCAMFSTETGCEWLVENSTLASRDEAESLMTEFLRFGWIRYVDDKYHKIREIEANSLLVHVTRVGVKVVVDLSSEQYESLHENPCSMDYKRNSVTSCDSNSTKSTLYLPNPSGKEKNAGKMTYTPLPPLTCTTDFESTMLPSYKCQEPSLVGSSPITGSLKSNVETRTSNLINLKNICNTPHLLILFREFLSLNFCAENLDFWMDYDSLRNRFLQQKTSTLPPINQTELLNDAYIIWERYLRPGAKYELNIGQSMSQEIEEEVSCMISVEPCSEKPGFIIHTNSIVYSLVIFFKWFDCVNEKVTKIMTMDSIPEFMKTSQYKGIIPANNHIECELDEFPPPPERHPGKTTTGEQARSNDVLSRRLLSDPRTKTEYIYIH